MPDDQAFNANDRGLPVVTPSHLNPAMPFVELFLVDPRNQKLLNLDVTPNNLLSLVVKESVSAAVPPQMAEVELFDTSFDFLEDLILTGMKNDKIEQQLNQQNGTGKPAYQWAYSFGYAPKPRSGVYAGTLVNIDYGFSRNGATIKLHLQSFIRSMSPVRSRTFRNAKTSDVVKQIMLEEGQTAIVEDTQVIWPEIRQNNLTNWGFLYEVLLQMVSSSWSIQQSSGNPAVTSGVKGFSATDAGQKSGFQKDSGVEMNALLFGSSKFIADNSGVLLYRIYRYGRDRQGQMINFNPKVDWHYAAIAKIVGNGFDFREANSLDSTFSRDDPNYTFPEELNQLFPTSRRLTPSRKAADDVKDCNRFYAVPYDDQESLDKWSANKINRMNFPLAATAELVGDPLIKAGHWIAVEIIKPNGQPHWTSGFYRVTGVEHNISASGYRTNLELVRFGFKSTQFKIEGNEGFAQLLRSEKEKLDKQGRTSEIDAPIVRYTQDLEDTDSVSEPPVNAEAYRNRPDLGVTPGENPPTQTDLPEGEQ